MQVHISKLCGRALRRMVAHCQDRPTFADLLRSPSSHLEDLMVKHKVSVSPDPSAGWIARSFGDAAGYTGISPSEAVMRCIVANNLGEIVDLPDGLNC